MRRIVLLVHNLRSCHNVGSILRTAEGLGVESVMLTGYTPYPLLENDSRITHEAKKINQRIAKTALGAEKFVNWQYQANIMTTIQELRNHGYKIFALEQTTNSISLPRFHPPNMLALVIGNEVEGVEQKIIDFCDQSIEIPMQGKKESFNVVQAAAMSLYYCVFC